jgi:hypothetical protein
MAPTTSNGRERTKKRHKIDFGHEVVILVGRQQTRFVTHKDLLVKSSTFFQAALSGNWRESQKNGILLPEEQAVSFSTYLNWLYGGFIDLWEEGEAIPTYKDANGREREDGGIHYHRITEAYLLGTFVGDDSFCNALIDSYFHTMDACNQWPGSNVCNIAFDNLVEGSKLRMLMVHHIAFRACADDFDGDDDNFSPDLVKNIAKVLVRETDPKGRDPGARGRCFYHVHGKDEKKCE